MNNHKARATPDRGAAALDGDVEDHRVAVAELGVALRDAGRRVTPRGRTVEVAGLGVPLVGGAAPRQATTDLRAHVSADQRLQRPPANSP